MLLVKHRKPILWWRIFLEISVMGIFSLLGYYVDVEVRTPRGRVDMVLRTETTLYVMELKLDKGADRAMEQINLKNYPERFALCGLPIIKIAVSFDSERCTIGEWKIMEG